MMMCNRLLNRDPENVDALMDRADAYLATEKWDEGILSFYFFYILFKRIWKSKGKKRCATSLILSRYHNVCFSNK
jgi:hypothetical protein